MSPHPHPHDKLLHSGPSRQNGLIIKCSARSRWVNKLLEIDQCEELLSSRLPHEGKNYLDHRSMTTKLPDETTKVETTTI